LKAKEEHMKRFLCALAGGLALVAFCGRGIAGPRVEADPSKLYPITPDVGPWVICAASFMGENAQHLAHDVVLQLRRRDNLPAYFYDYSAEERKRLQDYPGVRPGRKSRIQDQCGVLIGGYADQDAARKMLDQIKKLKMPDVDEKYLESVFNGADRRIYYANPFANAFVTRNPTVPHEQPAQPDDAGLRKLNAGESYSLLNNPRPWTLAIKAYYGISAVNSTSGSSSFLDAMWSKNKEGDVLSASGAQAHETARILRDLGMEAWVLHRRKESIVTVGGFEGPDDPKLKETVEKIKNWRETNVRRLGSDPFQLPLIPRPMRVPKV
jgi:hypothetical protein